MTCRISLIGEINDTKETWKLAIRITKMCFIQKTLGGGFLEMLLMDEKVVLHSLNYQLKLIKYYVHNWSPHDFFFFAHLLRDTRSKLQLTF